MNETKPLDDVPESVTREILRLLALFDSAYGYSTTLLIHKPGRMGLVALGDPSVCQYLMENLPDTVPPQQAQH